MDYKKIGSSILITMSANIKASTDGTQAIIGAGGVDQMTVSNAGIPSGAMWNDGGTVKIVP